MPLAKKLLLLSEPLEIMFKIDYEKYGFRYHDFFLNEFKKNFGLEKLRVKEEDYNLMKNGFT